ncbi:hypothetical protein SLA2020_432700 [Shorea laevis]
MIDISKALVVKGNKIWIEFQYENLLKFYFSYARIHRMEVEKQYGVWLRAQSFGRNLGGSDGRHGFATVEER